MSEEPPSLKIKPRQPAASGDSMPPVAPAGATSSSFTSPTGDTPRLRLKPRLLAEPPAASIYAPAAPVAEPAAPVPEPTEAEPVIKLRPRAALAPSGVAAPVIPPPPPAAEVLPQPPAPVPVTPAPGPEGPKFRLKPKSGESAPLGPAETASVPVSEPPPETPAELPAPPSGAAPVLFTTAKPPPFPVTAPETAKAPRPPSGIIIRPPMTAVEILAAARAPEAARKKSRNPKVGRLLGGAALLFLVVGGGLFAYQRYLESASTAAPAKKSAGKLPRRTDSGSSSAPAAGSGDAGALASNPKTAPATEEQQRVDDVLMADDPATKEPAPGARTRAPAAPSMGKLEANTIVAPGVTATTEIQGTSGASAAFRSFIADAKVSGVFQGSSPRAFINGRLIRVGQEVEDGLGITLNGIDAENRQLLFQDRFGAKVSKSY